MAVLLKVTKKDIMTFAWKDAKRAAKIHGGKAKDYISKCLKKAWESAFFLKGFSTVSEAISENDRWLGKFKSTAIFCLFFYSESYKAWKKVQDEDFRKNTPKWGGCIGGGNIYAANFG